MTTLRDLLGLLQDLAEGFAFWLRSILRRIVAWL